MLRLLPSVCRDCGASSEASALSRYLDFLLCSKCIGEREKALRGSGARRPAARYPEQERAPSGDEVQAPVAPGKKKRLPAAAATPKKTARKTPASPAKKPAAKPAAARKPKAPNPKR